MKDEDMDIDSQINKIIKETAQSGDFKKLDLIVSGFLTKYPIKTITAFLNQCKINLKNIVNTAHSSLYDRNEHYIKFKNSSFEIFIQALIKNPAEFSKIISDFIENTEYVMTAMKKVMETNIDIKSGLNRSNIVKMIDHMKQYLDIYDHDLKELIACACLICDLPHNKSYIENMSKKKRKEVLSKAVKNGDDVLLDDVYRHIRNSIAHGSYTIIDAKRKIKFVDDFKGKHWEKEFTYEQFMKIIFIPYLWMWAISFSKYVLFIVTFENMSTHHPLQK